MSITHKMTKLPITDIRALQKARDICQCMTLLFEEESVRRHAHDANNKLCDLIVGLRGDKTDDKEDLTKPF